MLWPLAGSVGAGDGQPKVSSVQLAGTGPIVVVVAVAAPLRGTVTPERARVTVWPWSACWRPAQFSEKSTLVVVSAPGANSPS